MSKEILTFISLLIIASISTLIPFVVKKIHAFSIPISVGEIIAGIIIGKSGFNLIEMNGELEFLYEVGLAFLMFLAGLEIDLHLIKKTQTAKNDRWYHNPLPIAVLNFVVSIDIAYIFALILQRIGIIPDTVIFAIVFCSTAVGIVVPTLKEKGILGMSYGQSVLIAAVISDFVTMLILSVYMMFFNKTSVAELLLILLFLPMFFLCKFLVSKLMLLKNFEQLRGSTSQLAVRLSYAVLLLFIVVSYFLKTEMILGAFLAGLMVSAANPRENNPIFEKFDAIGYGIFISIFFIIVGINFDLNSMLTHKTALLILPMIIAIIYIVNILSGLIYRCLYNNLLSIAASVILSSRLSLIIAAGAVAYKNQLIDASMNSVIVLTAIITCVISPIIFNKLYDKGIRSAHKKDNNNNHIILEEI